MVSCTGKGEVKPTLAIIHHPDYEIDFSPGSLEGPERLRAIRSRLQKYQPFLEPEPASESDLLLVHEPGLVAKLKSKPVLFQAILLATGGAIRCGQLAAAGRPAFGLLRPPGHHADRTGSWGFCYVNNMAIAVTRLRQDAGLRWITVVDLDHHVGDGTQRVLLSQPEISVINIVAAERRDYLEQVHNVLQAIRRAQLLAVSIGFDTYERDLGGLLKTEDYRVMGSWLRQTSMRLCGGRRFALLEGGYYLPDLGKNALAFCEGFE